jgi:hypothetical protein
MLNLRLFFLNINLSSNLLVALKWRWLKFIQLNYKHWKKVKFTKINNGNDSDLRRFNMFLYKQNFIHLITVTHVH